jgi:hypothetical protein
MTVFCDVAPRSLVEIDRRFRGASCFYHSPDDEDGNHLWNVDQFVPDDMAEYPRRHFRNRRGENLKCHEMKEISRQPDSYAEVVPGIILSALSRDCRNEDKVLQTWR